MCFDVHKKALQELLCGGLDFLICILHNNNYIPVIIVIMFIIINITLIISLCSLLRSTGYLKLYYYYCYLIFF